MQSTAWSLYFICQFLRKVTAQLQLISVVVFVSQVLNQSAVDYINGSVSASQVGSYFGKSFLSLIKVIECNIHASIHILNLFVQALLPREQLEKQYCSNGVQSQHQISSFRAAAVRNAIPDPDVPQSCANSSEYVRLSTSS